MLLELASDLAYFPGDHIGVFACNQQEIVDGVLDRLQMQSNIKPDVPIEVQLQKENHTPNGIDTLLYL